MRCEGASRRTAAGMALALFVFVLAALALAACAGGEEEKATLTATPVASPTATATATVSATPQPSPTSEPTLTPSPAATRLPLRPDGVTPAPTPSWQTSAPREPVPASEVVELGIRNKNGAPGQTYIIAVQVNLPDGSFVNMEVEVVGDDWTYFPVGETDLPGTYTVYFGQGDLIYAEDFFEVSEE